MQTHELVSVHEYLATCYRPDCDYVDGIIEERNMGEWDHGRVQALLVGFFLSRERRLGIRVVPEQRVQVKPTRFRIPDVCVVAGPEPAEQILTRPPFICIEILSRDDRMSDMQERVQDYLEFGVPYVWILDPKSHQAWRCSPGEMRQETELRTENPAILVPLDEIFA
jgi:Uma2 family endonuclease